MTNKSINPSSDCKFESTRWDWDETFLIHCPVSTAWHCWFYYLLRSTFHLYLSLIITVYSNFIHDSVLQWWTLTFHFLSNIIRCCGQQNNMYCQYDCALLIFAVYESKMWHAFFSFIKEQYLTSPKCFNDCWYHNKEFIHVPFSSSWYHINNVSIVSSDWKMFTWHFLLR